MNPEQALSEISDLMLDLPPTACNHFSIAIYRGKLHRYSRGQIPPSATVLLEFTRAAAAKGLTTNQWNDLLQSLAILFPRSRTL